jgi:hypothetical protein
MNYIELLGVDLKCDFLCDLFETYDVQVVYDYDRTHENMPDKYHAKIPDLGLEFIFDETKILATLFVVPVEIKSFNPFSDAYNGINKFRSKDEAINYAIKYGLKYKIGNSDFMGENKDWISFKYNGYSIHYEFTNSELRMITLQSNDA